MDLYNRQCCVDIRACWVRLTFLSSLIDQSFRSEALKNQRDVEKESEVTLEGASNIYTTETAER